MFDYINCEYILPDCPKDIDPEFQTKSLHNYLETYTITEEGRLIKDNGAGTMVDLFHHGTIVFYTSLKNNESLDWIQYKAKFTDGQLTCIEREYINWDDSAYPKKGQDQDV
jgi:hypothetical protein